MIKRLIQRLTAEKKPDAIVPKIEASKLLGSEIHIDLIEPETKDGNVSLTELVILSQIVKLSKAAKIFEIGTFDGRTTTNLSRNASNDAKIFTMDLGEKEIEELLKNPHGDRKYIGKIKSGWRFERKPEANKIVQLFGDSAKFDFTPYENSIEFLFIDGAHQYEYVLKDSETALLITKLGSVIFWHDYNTSWPGVTKALNELYQKDKRFRDIKNIRGTSLVYLKRE